MIDIISIADSRWLGFTSRQSDATIFHHPAWAGLLAECYGFRPLVLARVDNRSQVDGGVPLIDIHGKLTGRRAVSLPFSDFCSPLCDNEDIDSLVRGLQDWRTKNGILQIAIHWPIRGGDDIFVGEKAYRHMTQLHPKPEEIFRRFKKTQVQQSIRQAEHSGIVIAHEDGWSAVQQFYGLHLQTRKRLGIPIQPLRFFRLVWENLVSRGLGFVLLAYRKDYLIAGSVFLHWNKTLTYKYSASDPKYWQHRPNNLILWHAMRWGCENGYDVFDWGKTDVENQGLRAFKRGWGSEEQLLHYTVLADHPPKPAGSGRPRNVLRFVIQRSPPWVCRAAGEMLYRFAA